MTCLAWRFSAASGKPRTGCAGRTPGATAACCNRRLSIASRLEDFAAAGELTIVDDQLDDMSAIVDIVERVKDAGVLSCVALDIEGPYGEFVDALAGIDVTEASEQIVGIGQGYRLMGAIKTVERKLANGTMVHAPSGLMDWCCGNVKIEADRDRDPRHQAERRRCQDRSVVRADGCRDGDGEKPRPRRRNRNCSSPEGIPPC